jgi:RNA 2',3'-cyclic 3'-phosphodiesterase
VKSRLFIAIDMPAAYLGELQKKISQAYARLRFTSSFHLTLKFIGMAEPEEIIRQLDFEFKPFILKTDKIGFFSPKQIRVIWLGFKQSNELSALQEKIEERLPVKDNKFHPHVTLARVSEVHDRTKLLDSLDLEVEEKTVPVDSYSLYESALTPQGPVYSKLKEFKGF